MSSYTIMLLQHCCTICERWTYECDIQVFTNFWPYFECICALVCFFALCPCWLLTCVKSIRNLKPGSSVNQIILSDHRSITNFSLSPQLPAVYRSNYNVYHEDIDCIFKVCGDEGPGCWYHRGRLWNTHAEWKYWHSGPGTAQKWHEAPTHTQPAKHHTV